MINIDTQDFNSVLEKFLTKDDKFKVRNLIKFDYYNNSAKSTKLSNYTISWNNIMIDTADITLKSAGALTYNWLVPFIALLIWNKIYSKITIDITTEHAILLSQLWNVKPRYRNFIKLDEVDFDMTEDQIELKLSQLEELKCIERSDDKIYLRESVQVKL